MDMSRYPYFNIDKVTLQILPEDQPLFIPRHIRYFRSIKRNICERSQNKINFNEAIKQWVYQNGSGRIDDSLLQNCQLCGFKHIKIYFTIRNIHDFSQMKIGSICIQKFPINIYIQEQLLKGEQEIAQFFNYQIANTIQTHQQGLKVQGLTILRQLLQGYPKRKRYIIITAIEQYSIERKISLSNAVFIFSELKRKGIKYEPKLFKLKLQNQIDDNYLTTLHDYQKKSLIEAMTKAQLKRLAAINKKKQHQRLITYYMRKVEKLQLAEKQYQIY